MRRIVLSVAFDVDSDDDGLLRLDALRALQALESAAIRLRWVRVDDTFEVGAVDVVAVATGDGYEYREAT